MQKIISFIFLIIILVVVLIFSGAFYVIDETEQVVVTQFGRLVGQPITEAGLYFKLPFVQKANRFDKRLLQWDGDANEIPTRDGRFIWVDTTARWRIADPLKFMQSVRTEPSAQTRLDDIIDAATRDVISSHVLVEAVRNTNRLLENQKNEEHDDTFGKTTIDPIQIGREALNRKILKKASMTVPNYGIELVDVKIKRINYKDSVQNKVYERMISERKRAAEQFRSEGQGEKARISGLREKELQRIQSEAYKTAQEIKGKADAQAIKIYADAYNLDPEFYSFIKTLETYKNTIDKDTTLLLSTENDFYEYLQGGAIE